MTAAPRSEPGGPAEPATEWGLREALEWALDCLSADDYVPPLGLAERASVKHAIARDHKWTPECVDCKPLITVDLAVAEWPSKSVEYVNTYALARKLLGEAADRAAPASPTVEELAAALAVAGVDPATDTCTMDDHHGPEFAAALAEALGRAPRSPTVEELAAAIDKLDTVPVEWAPAHSAPYVSRELVKAVVAGMLSGAAPRSVEAGLPSAERLVEGLAAIYARTTEISWRSWSGIVGELCDEYLDPSGALLGRVRERARLSAAEGTETP